MNFMEFINFLLLNRFAYSVVRGSLLFALPLGLDFKIVAHKYGNID